MADGIEGYMEGVDVHTRDEFLKERARLMQLFGKISIVVDDAIEQEEKVAVRWHVDATHTGDAPGLPATNRSVSFRGMSWLEFKEGRIVRGWDSWNLGGLLQSLAPA
jgi:steroid delta-isomerase-like uncharacterized protein